MVLENETKSLCITLNCNNLSIFRYRNIAMNKKLFSSFLIVLFISVQTVKAANVDTIEVFSAVMNRKIKAVVITPADYAKGKDSPVVYLLHGFGGAYDNWVRNMPFIKEVAEVYYILIVCALVINCCYFNSLVDST